MKSIFLLFTVVLFPQFIEAKVQRNVAILWDSSEADVESYTFSLAHRKLEVILNHYGFKAIYFDIDRKNFSAREISPKDFQALISWFSDDEAQNPEQVRAVFKEWFIAKKKVISLGQLGFFYNRKQQGFDLEEINKTLKHVGIAYEDIVYESSLGLKIQYNTDRNNLEFERDFSYEVPAVKVFKNLDAKNVIWANIEDTINKKKSPVVLHNQHFFMVHAGFDIFYNPVRHFTQWRINPFALIKWLISDSLQPVPDTTTLYGKRIYYAHIDGDAFINLSDIDQQDISGNVLVREILSQYKLPTTVSYIVAELDLKELGKPNFLKSAQAIAALPYIEIASHTYFHPLSWRKKPSQYEIDAYLGEPKNYKGGPILAYRPKDGKLDYEREIKGSIDFINNYVMPEGKSSNFILWSGSCEPPEEALKIAYNNKLINMNGGDSRFDKSFPSYSHLLPLYRSVGNYIQYYSSNSNEIPYTANWTGPFSGYENVLETYKNTESPIRIKPINTYYHFYSGEKKSAINALKKIYDWVVAQDIFPIFGSLYPRILAGFIDVKMERVGERAYIFKNAGELKTFRVDNDQWHIDYYKSENIIGHRLYQGSLYIHIGNKDYGKIVLTKEEPQHPYLVSSSYSLDLFTISEKDIKIRGKSNFQKDMILHTGKKRIAPKHGVEITYQDALAHLRFNDEAIDLKLEIINASY